MISPAWTWVISRLSITSAILETSLALSSSSSGLGKPRSAITLPELTLPRGDAVVRLLFRLMLLFPFLVDDPLPKRVPSKQFCDLRLRGGLFSVLPCAG